MWEMFKQCCNNDKREMLKLLTQIIIFGSFGAMWFYMMALSITLIGG